MKAIINRNNPLFIKQGSYFAMIEDENKCAYVGQAFTKNPASGKKYSYTVFQKNGKMYYLKGSELIPKNFENIHRCFFN